MIADQNANVVVLPVGAQIAQLNQLWLYKNEILGEDGQGLFTPVAIQASDADVDLLLVPNRLQIVGRRPEYAEGLVLAAERAARLIAAAGGAVLGALNGLGLNVQVFMSLKDHPHQKALLERSFVKEGALDHFSKERHIGLSILEQFDGYRLTTKFDHAQNMSTGDSGLSMDVNVHVDLHGVAEAIAFLDRVQEFSAKIQERVTRFETDVIGVQS